MADEEVLRSISRSLERMDGHAERGTQLFEENRIFTRDLVRRQEKVTNELVRQIAAQTAAIEKHSREFAAEMREQRREFVSEMRAQRGALFRILDRLDGEGGQASA